VLAEAFDLASPSRPSFCDRFKFRFSFDKDVDRQHPMALTPSLDERYLEGISIGSDSTSSEGGIERIGSLSRFGERVSWIKHFQEDASREELADRCADAIVEMLLDNPRVFNASGGRSALNDRVHVALTCAFHYLRQPGCLSSGCVSGEVIDGSVVGVAVEELLRTSEAAGFIVERFMGPDLRTSLSLNFGELATMAASEICWGLAALVEQLESPSAATLEMPNHSWARSGRVRRMLKEWMVEWGLERELEEGDTMLSLIRDKILQEDNPISNPVQSAALWMLQSDADQYSVCPDPITAFRAHARCASVLAEGILLAFESWNDENALRRSPSPDGDGASSAATSGPTLQLPAAFGSPLVLHQNWIGWKVHKQGQDMRGAATYILDRRPGIVRRRSLGTGLASAFMDAP
jgi:hypothetical protein